MRYFRNVPDGLRQGLIIGYFVSSLITLNSTDDDLRKGGSVKCLMAMMLLTLLGGFVGFFNSYRRDAREEVPDTFDKLCMLGAFVGIGYFYSNTPSVFSIFEDLKRRWDNHFQLQPGPQLD